MAQRVITQMLDDIDGSTAAESIQFGLDGKSYTIDLSVENASKMREDLSRYVTNASLLTNHKQKQPKKAASNGEDKTKIREWAKQNGYTISERGRISQEINQKYLASLKAAEVPAQPTPAFYGG